MSMKNTIQLTEHHEQISHTGEIDLFYEYMNIYYQIAFLTNFS